MQSLGCWHARGQRSGILPIKVNTYINTVKTEQFPSINLQTSLTATQISSKVSKTSLKLCLHAGAVPLQWMEVTAFARWLTPPWLGDSSLLTKTLQPAWWIAVEITDMPWYHYGISRSAQKKKGLKKKKKKAHPWANTCKQQWPQGVPASPFSLPAQPGIQRFLLSGPLQNPQGHPWDKGEHG